MGFRAAACDRTGDSLFIYSKAGRERFVFFAEFHIMKEGQGSVTGLERNFVMNDQVLQKPVIIGKIHSVESFGSADGPGVRYIIFLKGCNMRCKYCHNPDTWAGGAGEEKTPEEVLKQALRYRNYWRNNGGITVSGGEALLQIDFVTELFRLAKEQGVHTCLDTSGNPFTREQPFYGKFERLMDVTDLFLLDIKHMDPAGHKELTGCDNGNILDMARCLSEHGKAMWIRHVLVPGITDDEKQLRELKKFTDTLKTVERVEILPYHTLGVFKWKELGIPYALEGVNPPDENAISRAKEILGI